MNAVKIVILRSSKSLFISAPIRNIRKAINNDITVNPMMLPIVASNLSTPLSADNMAITGPMMNANPSSVNIILFKCLIIKILQLKTLQ